MIDPDAAEVALNNLPFVPCEILTHEQIQTLSGGRTVTALEAWDLPLTVCQKLWLVFRRGILSESVFKQAAPYAHLLMANPEDTDAYNSIRNIFLESGE